MTLPKQKSVRIFGAGGLGVNIASQFVGRDTSLGCQLDVAYFDTSRSNLPANSESMTYLVPEVDGAGKQRAPILPMVIPHITPALRNHPPRDLNLVIFSGSGGTGSVAGPLLVNEMLNRGHAVIALVLGDTDSGKAADNTIKTLTSLSALAGKQNQPVVVFYRDMSGDVNRRTVDDLFVNAITCVASLIGATAQPNSELDTQDLMSWLNYHKSTDFPAGLSLLNIYGSNAEIADLDGAISVASLYSSPDEAHGQIRTAYRATGYTPVAKAPMHFVITQSGMTALMDTLKRRLDEVNSAKARLVSQHVQFHQPSDNDSFLVV